MKKIPNKIHLLIFFPKMNALMGTYDPLHIVSDNERSSGNILQAMIQFPTDYSFTIMGKTNGDEKLKQIYLNDVKRIISLGNHSEKVELRIVERGTRFIKISVTVTVDSAAVINTIYDALRSLEMTVMTY